MSAKVSVWPAMDEGWQYKLKENIHPEYGPRFYRFNVDNTKGQTSCARTTAEYFNEKRNEWRSVNSWHTKDWLYHAVMNADGTTKKDTQP